MDAYVWNAGFINPPMIVAVEVARIDWRADRTGEDEAIVAPGRAQGCTLLILLDLLLPQCFHDGRKDRHRSAGRATLGRLDHRSAIQRHNGLPDVQDAALPVHVLPAQAEDLAAAHPRREQHLPHGVVGTGPSPLRESTVSDRVSMSASLAVERAAASRHRRRCAPPGRDSGPGPALDAGAGGRVARCAARSRQRVYRRRTAANGPA